MPSIESPPALLAALEDELAALPASPAAQRRALEGLFRLFTSERRRLTRSRYLESPPLRSAYLRYYLPLNAARATCVLRDVRRLAPEIDQFEDIVDLGAGPGSASLASFFALPNTPPRRFLLCDQSSSGLGLARKLLVRSAELAGRTPVPLSLRAVRFPALPRLPPRAFVWLCMVLNEIETAQRAAWNPAPFFERLRRELDPGSVLAVVEPALRLPGRRLLEVHDQLLASGGWEVVAPCTHQERCPLLAASGRPWCHFHFDWKAPPFVEEIAGPLGLTRGHHSIAYLVLRRREAAEHSAAKTGSPSRARVIGDPMTVHGGERGLYICQHGQRRTLVSTQADLGRGDIIKAGRRGTPSQVLAPWPG
jgi:ribosomal protein RSM22 (predicted rRNA methylase)